MVGLRSAIRHRSLSLRARRHCHPTSVPSGLAQRGPHGLFTWVVKPDNTVEPRPIQTGSTAGDRTIVVSGVQDGERVVIGGQYKLQTNAPVSVTAPPTAATPDHAS